MNKAKGGGVRGSSLAIIIWQSSHQPDFLSACQLCDVLRVMVVIRLHTLGSDGGVLVGLLRFLLSNKLSSYWHDCWTCHTPPALLRHPAEIRCKGLDPSQALAFSVFLVLQWVFSSTCPLELVEASLTVELIYELLSHTCTASGFLTKFGALKPKYITYRIPEVLRKALGFFSL